MDWYTTLPIIDVPTLGQTEPIATGAVFRSTTECPYVRWDMILIGVAVGAMAVYLWRK